MKRLYIFVLISLIVVLLASCKVNIAGNEEFEKISYIVEHSTPIRIENVTTYNDQNNGVVLNSSFTMTIGQYEGSKSAMIEYSYQRLNEIGADEFISTIIGSSSSNDSDYEQIATDAFFDGLNMNISWFSNINITKIDAQLVMTALVYNENVYNVFGNNYSITNAEITLTANNDLLESIVVNYTANTGALVTVNNTYLYNSENQ